MPELDGLETIKNVRKLNSSVDPVPIVVITAFDVYGMPMRNLLAILGLLTFTCLGSADIGTLCSTS